MIMYYLINCMLLTSLNDYVLFDKLHAIDILE